MKSVSDEDDHKKGKQKEEHIWKTTIGTWIDDNQNELSSTLMAGLVYTPFMSHCHNRHTYCSSAKTIRTIERKPTIIANLWDNKSCFICSKQLLDEGMWNDIPALNRLDGYSHDEEKIWQMANAKIEDAIPSKILKIKNNPPELVNIIHISNPDAFMNEKTSPEDFHKYYQNLAPTREEQEQHLEQLNTRLCDYCLIPCDFQYCNKCDLIYNPLPCMIYTILEEIKPISSCTSELESPFDPDSNSDNNDNENTDSNSNPKYEQYIALSDLFKEQELKWYSDNNEGIMSEHVHNTDAGFDLRYPEKNVIKLEPHSHTCIDLKVALEIPVTTMVQLASRSSLVKRGINIKGEIIDAEYM
ncbi:hypothetical protein G9A89_012261 [Geosiphon pyriformis]|nr:hypothetical protein G9A89_012261 [Geosiphon pyriformis]